MKKKGWKFFSKNAGLEIFEGVSKGKRENSGCVFLTAFSLEKGGNQLTIKLDPTEAHFLSRAILSTLKKGSEKYQTFIYHSVDEGKTSSSLSLKVGKVGLLVKVTRKNGDESSIVVPVSKDNAIFLSELLKHLSTHCAWVERVESGSTKTQTQKKQKEETPEDGSPEELPPPEELDEIEDIDF